MDTIHIAELKPELAARDSKQFRAAVTLIWPYSSSQREFALLFAEPEFRMRRKKGQVRARFTGSSAKALATTGVGIGDEVVLSLRGAQFVKEGSVSTPGRSIEWELEYAQTVIIHVFRNGNEIASLDVVDVAPTPAPRSPVRRVPAAAPSLAQQWSSPAFLKRARLSDGPFFEAPYDPLADENAEGHDKKRRRKSYRNWKTWTYHARTPSTEKEDVGMEDDFEVQASPSRAMKLPHTPVSPPKAEQLSVAAGQMDGARDVNDDAQDQQTHTVTVLDDDDDFVRDNDYYDLYAGPDEIPPADAPFAFGGDTEANTEEEDAQENAQDARFSTTEVNTGSQETGMELEPEHAVEPPGDPQPFDLGSDTEEDSVLEVVDTRRVSSSAHGNDIKHTSNRSPAAVQVTLLKPPPAIPTIMASDMLTPVGQEPASPTLQPLDSALLPLPSPFPDERNAATASYFDRTPDALTSEVPETIEQEPMSDASYILENSFFSSIGSGNNLTTLPHHESAFAQVRFTFGMDSVNNSRPLNLSSPAPEAPDRDEELKQLGSGLPAPVEPISLTGMQKDMRTRSSSPGPIDSHTILETLATDYRLSSPPRKSQIDNRPEPEVIELSSDSEEEESEDEKMDDGDDIAGPERQGGPDLGHAMSDLYHISSDEEEPEVHETLSDRQEKADLDLAAPTSTNHSTAASAIVDLGSPSGSSDVEDVEEIEAEVEVDEESQGRVDHSGKQPDLDTAASVQGPDRSAEKEDFSEFTAMDFVPEVSTTATDIREEAPAHTSTSQEVEAVFETGTAYPSIFDDYEPQLGIDELDTMQGEGPEDVGAADHHPDVKMESIEEDSVLHLIEPDVYDNHNGLDEGVAGPSAEILIEVPEEGHKLGELHTIAVPATGPARNTRSKTKPSMSPSKEEPPVQNRASRSTRSKASVTPFTRTTVSPARTRNRSTMSPSRDATQTSPYSLRSQSKMLSPPSAATSARRRSPRKRALNRSVDSISDVSPSQLDDADPILTSFEPSQHLGASQGRYSDVAFVKDSEEESLHSEHSLSSVKYSDDWNTFTNFSDPVMPHDQDEDDVDMRPPAATAPELDTGMGAKTRWKKSQAQTIMHGSRPVQPNFSFITQPQAGSPSRKLRSAGSMVSSSTPATRRTRRHIYNLSSSPPPAEESANETTPKVAQAVEGESYDIRSSPPASIDLEATRYSPSPITSAFPSVVQQSVIDSNRPVTPDATQQTSMESQASVTVQQQQTLPMTPQLTQRTSMSLRSFNASTQNDSTAVEVSPKAKPSPNVVMRSTPRRNATQTDVASPDTSPVDEHSPDVSDAKSTLVEKPAGPSIGLSTLVAFYTPLKELTFFLNRSSQFHTASNPDVLALVTSGTTPATRATKGRKDWSTSLHITDASTWPAVTTVNVFRGYQNALPLADAGDVILLRAFAVKSLNRHPTLTSADESSWCAWRYKKPVWGKKKGAFGEVRAREEVRGPVVEMGEGEWAEVERLRVWFEGCVKGELEAKELRTRSHDGSGEVVGEGSPRLRRSRG